MQDAYNADCAGETLTQSLKAEDAPPTLPLSKDTSARIRKHIQALDDPVQEVNVEAENRLIHFGAKAVEQLLPTLDHPNPMVRLRAGWILGLSRDPRAFEPLCRLLRDPDERVRYDIAVALGHYGDERAVPILRQAAEYASDCVLSAGAVQGLALFGIRLFPDDT